MNKTRVFFLCVHNSTRSHTAEVFVRTYTGGRLHRYFDDPASSTGTVEINFVKSGIK